MEKPGRREPRNSRKAKAPEPDPLLVNLGLTSQIGLTMAASILVGLYLGYQLDKWSGGGHLWKFICIPLGIAAGFWAVYKIIDKVLTCEEKDK